MSWHSSFHPYILTLFLFIRSYFYPPLFIDIFYPPSSPINSNSPIKTMDILLYTLLALNAVTFVVYGIDKAKARRGNWRITEATLLAMAALGGSIGAWMGMKVWHHKTLHAKFRYGVPIILLLQAALATYLYINYRQ